MLNTYPFSVLSGNVFESSVPKSAFLKGCFGRTGQDGLLKEPDWKSLHQRGLLKLPDCLLIG